jgi:hypothetical protein
MVDLTFEQAKAIRKSLDLMWDIEMEDPQMGPTDHLILEATRTQFRAITKRRPTK